MSALPPKADINPHRLECLLLAISGHLAIWIGSEYCQCGDCNSASFRTMMARESWKFEAPPLNYTGDAELIRSSAPMLDRRGNVVLIVAFWADHDVQKRGKSVMTVVNSSRFLGQSVVALILLTGTLVPTAAQTPGEKFQDCPDCPRMVVLPSGQFTMGSPANERGGQDFERPQRSVTIPYTIAVSRFEITFAEWDACLANFGCNGYMPSDEGWGRGQRPVINISWYDAKSYVAWLKRKTGKAYRLLSEAEWEYAARARTTTPFSTGQAITSDQANFNGWVSYEGPPDPEGQYRGKTIAVGSLTANAFGLYDVHGNVWEWVEDCWNDGYSGVPTNGSADTTGDCGQRVLRGGSWDLDPEFLRSAGRYWIASVFQVDYIGFRVARTLAP